MSDNIEGPILQHLRRIDERLDQFGADMTDMRARMASMRTEMVVLYHFMETIDARFDRMEKSFGRIGA
jgi:hypothetical protein